MQLGHALSVAILACLVTLVVSYLAAPASQAAAPAAVRAGPQGISAESMAQIDERLERIESALAVLASTPAPRRPIETGTTRTTTEGDRRRPIDGELAILEHLEGSEKVLHRTVPLSAGSAAVPLDRAAPIVWDAIDELRRQDTGDGKAAIRELRLMTPAEVITRFGSPSRAEAAHGNDWDMWWSYDHANGTHLELYFKGDYVLYAEND